MKTQEEKLLAACMALVTFPVGFGVMVFFTAFSAVGALLIVLSFCSGIFRFFIPADAGEEKGLKKQGQPRKKKN
jgi:putative effector of murein hydrolase LrgA (UPF0299 family)